MFLQSVLKLVIAFLVAVIISAVFIGVLWYFFGPGDVGYAVLHKLGVEHNEEVDTAYSDTRLSVPELGSLIMSVEKVGEDLNVWQIFSVGLDDEEAELVNESVKYEIFSSASLKTVDPEAPEHFFFKSLVLAEEGEGLEIGLFENTVDTVTRWPITLPQNHGRYDWSPSLDLLAYAENESETVDIDKWNIKISSREGELVDTIVGGFNPVWDLAGGTLLYLKMDGFYQYNAVTNESKQLMPMKFENRTNAARPAFAISADNETIAIAFGKVLLFRIDPWDYSNISELRVVESDSHYYFNPILNLTGEYFAIVSFPKTQAAEPQIDIYELWGNEAVKTIPLAGRDFNQLQLDDWVSYVPEL